MSVASKCTIQKVKLDGQSVCLSILASMESYLPIIFHLKEIASHYKHTGKLPALLGDCHSSLAVTDTTSCENEEKGKSPEASEPYIPVSCCGLSFRFPSHYKNHLDSDYHNSRLERTCSVCAKYFNTKKALAAHKKEHDVKLPCEVCGIIFTSGYLLSAHKRQMHSSSLSIKCDKCPFKTWNKYYLTRHKRRCIALKPTVNQSQKSSFEPIDCCGHTFKYASHLERHKKHCRQTKTYNCKMCNEYFEEEESLNQHRINVHKIEGGRWTCMICNETFSTNGILKTHMQSVHIKSTVFECAKCPFSSHRKDFLKRHFLSCHAEKAPRFCCDHCGRSFVRKDTLAAHIKNIHFSNIPHCEICSRQFKTIEEVEKHKLSHRPCQICGKKFTLLKHREAHIRKHLSQNGQSSIKKTSA
ncbi:zinc finger protein 98-like isoform X2 [Thrips palmi]|uniref:Zinc finger protein 98-like isoform X2 n=1 Tax=Thrips palmi TaxID=161013 RepID=A0A6P8ZJ44_THRPL|nr:zinc finger protein 98-like isoform X2 [Thrips palmi]